MRKFVHVYHLLCGHSKEEAMTSYERKEWENKGYTEHRVEHEDHGHRCWECEDRYQREKDWRQVLEGEYALGLFPLSGDRVARYIRLREVQRIQKFWCDYSWFSPQTNERLFQMYLDYIRLFPDAQSWSDHWGSKGKWKSSEAQWKSKDFLTDQQLNIQFQGSLPPEERRTYELRYLSQQEAVVVRPLDFPFIEQWRTVVKQIAPGESLVLSVCYYDDEVVQRAPWTLEQDCRYYLIDSSTHLHILWAATPAKYRYRDYHRTHSPLVRRSFHVIATPATWNSLKVNLKPSWRMGMPLGGGRSEKSGFPSWYAFFPQNDACRRLVNETGMLHLFQQEGDIMANAHTSEYFTENDTL